MLRHDIFNWILIVWIMCTCIISLDIYVRIENDKATKRMDAIAQEMSAKYFTTTSSEVPPEEIHEIEETETKIEAVPVKRYYDVPLEEPLQDHIFILCEEYGIDPAIVIAMIGKESVNNPHAVGDGGNSLGLMQIQPRWHKDRMKRLGITSLFNPYQNVTVGIDILRELFATGKSTEWVLMAYNGGQAYANEKAALGIVSDYANTVIANARTLNTYYVEVRENRDEKTI